MRYSSGGCRSTGLSAKTQYGTSPNSYAIPVGKDLTVSAGRSKTGFLLAQMILGMMYAMPNSIGNSSIRAYLNLLCDSRRVHGDDVAAAVDIRQEAP